MSMGTDNNVRMPITAMVRTPTVTACQFLSENRIRPSIERSLNIACRRASMLAGVVAAVFQGRRIHPQAFGKRVAGLQDHIVVQGQAAEHADPHAVVDA